MSSTLFIRSATSPDLPAIHSLAHAIWPLCYSSILSPAQIAYMLDRMYALKQLQSDLDAGISFDLLFDAEMPIAFAAYGTSQTAPTECKLHKLYLLPSHHGRGLGTLLLQHVIAAARNYPFTALTLNVNKHNTRAIDLYKRHGFGVRNSVVVDIGGGFFMDDHVMSLML